MENQPTNPTELFTQRTFKTIEFHKSKPSLWRKFVVYVEGTLTSINFPPRNWKGYYAYL